MKAADLDEALVVGLVQAERERTGADAVLWNLAEQLPGVPLKVLLAKLRRLVRRGILSGCACGCRGDFAVEALI